MKIFDLEHFIAVDNGKEVNVGFKPTETSISDFICHYKHYSSIEEMNSDIENYKAIIKPILFSEFQQMENIPISLREQFEL